MAGKKVNLNQIIRLLSLQCGFHVIAFFFFMPNIMPSIIGCRCCLNDEHLQLLTRKGGESVKK